MSEEKVTVRIEGDSSGVEAAVERAKKSVHSLGESLAQLNGSFSRVSSAAGAAFDKMANDAKTAVNTVETYLGAALQRMVADAGQASAKMGKHLQDGFAKARENSHSVVESMTDFADKAKDAFGTAQEVVAFARGVGEAAQKTRTLSQQLGVGVGDVQRLGALAKLTGTDVDKLGGGMGKLGQSFAQAKNGSKEQAAAFRQLGIDTKGNYTQMELLQLAMGKFGQMADGPQKAALAMKVFGDASADVGPALSMSQEAQAAYNKSLADYGVVNEGAVAKGVALNEAFEQSDVAVSGLQNVMMDALAPAVTAVVEGVNGLIAAFIKSYKEGGAVAVLFKAVSNVIEEVTTVVGALLEIFGALWDAVVSIVTDIAKEIANAFGAEVPGNIDVMNTALNVFKGIIGVVKAAALVFVAVVKAGFLILVDTLVMFGNIARDALTLNWGAIAGDWAAGMAKIGRHVANAAREVKAAVEDRGEAPAPTPAPAVSGTSTGKVGGNTGGPRGSGGGTSSRRSSGGAAAKPDDRFDGWQKGLEAKRQATRDAADEEGKIREMSLQDEVAYWKKILDETTMSETERAKVHNAFVDAHQRLLKKEIDDRIAGFEKELEAARGNAKERLRIAQEEERYIADKLGEESEERKRAAERVKQIQDEAADEERKLADELYAHKRKLDEMDVDEAQRNAEFKVEMGEMTQTELLRLEQEFENARYRIRRAALERDRQLALESGETERFRAASEQIELLDRQHQQKLTEIDRKAILQRTAMQRQAITSIANLWAQNLGKLLTLQQSFAATLKNLYTGMVNIVSNILSQLIEKWLVKHITALFQAGTASRAQAQADIMNQGAAAGAGGVASMAKAPWPISMGAPAFGAAMLAAAVAFTAGLSIASGRGGIWEVGEGLHMLHEQEMVLPQHLAAPLRNLIAGGAGGGGGATPANLNAPFAANDGRGGGDHIHIHAVDAPSFKRLLMDRAPDVVAAVRKHVRNNGA